MLIDWFTVAAQIVNFLILVWLLKRFLYGRIIRAVEARERRIAENLTQAEAKETAAAEQLAQYEVKYREFEQTRDDLLAQARLEAEKQQGEMIEKAREHVHSLETGWQEDLDCERNAFLADLRRRAASEILALAGKTVADLACVDIQRCAVQVFLEKLQALDRDACQNLRASELSVRTPFDLSDNTRAEIERTLQNRLGGPVRLRFERVPEIGLGLELRGNGWRFGWNSEAYLESLEDDLREALKLGTAGERPLLAAEAHAGAR
jgi:F-type H+-transporting ATPase subunit b